MSESFIQEAVLVGGPQDGARVKAVGGFIPQTIHVGPKWLGDGYSAWTADGPCKRFPARYILDGYKYRFDCIINPQVSAGLKT